MACRWLDAARLVNSGWLISKLIHERHGVVGVGQAVYDIELLIAMTVKMGTILHGSIVRRRGRYLS